MGRQAVGNIEILGVKIGPVGRKEELCDNTPTRHPVEALGSCVMKIKPTFELHRPTSIARRGTPDTQSTKVDPS